MGRLSRINVISGVNQLMPAVGPNGLLDQTFGFDSIGNLLNRTLNAPATPRQKDPRFTPILLSRKRDRFHALLAKYPWPSIEKAALRDFDQLYARADTMYRLHWAAVEARLNGQPFQLPEPAIIMRRRSVEWIAGSPYDWDDVPLDT
jgi:Domain of unknown function (DUF4272)